MNSQIYSWLTLLIMTLFALVMPSTVEGQLFRRPPVKSRDSPPSPPANDAPALPPGVCPCMRAPSGSSCVPIAYNERYQAVSLDEVITNFIDPTMQDPSQALNIIGLKLPTSKQNPYKCKSLECMACYRELSEKLLQQWGPVDSAGLGLYPGLSSMTPQVVGSTAHGAPHQCSRLHPQQSQATAQTQSKSNSVGTQSRKSLRPAGSSSSARTSSTGGNGNANGNAGGNGNANGNAGTGTGNGNVGVNAAGLMEMGDDAAWLLLGELTRTSLSVPDSNNSNSSWINGSTTTPYPTAAFSSSTPNHYYYSSSTSNPRRNKRDSPPGTSSAGALGVTTPLDCSYKKGDPLDDNSGYVGLCNLCWSLRTLPPKYYPRYINELSCDSSDNSCLGGYGKCRERYRSVDVLYNSGTDAAPKWQQYSINSPVACECQVAAGSAGHEAFTKGKP